MAAFFSTEARVASAINLAEFELERARSDGCCLSGVRVLVITSGHEATDHRIYGKEAVSLERFGADVTVVGVLQHSIPGTVPVVSVPKARSRLVRFVLQPWRCVWTARKLSAEIIHFHDPEMLAVLPVARFWWSKAKFVYDVHEDFSNLMLIRDWLPNRLKPLVKAATDCVEKTIALFADAIVGVTPPLAEKFGTKEKIVAYNYVPRAFFDASAKLNIPPNNREFDLVHLGTLNLRRAQFLSQILQEFHRIRPEARSSIIGVSPEIQEVMSGLVPNGCTLIGKVPHEQIPELLGNAKVGLDVHPWLGPHLEVAVPVKVCEYMAAGCAVVTSYMPVLKRILDEAGIDSDDLRVIDGENPTDYARAILQMIEMIEKGAGPGARLQQAALRHMVWEKEAAKIARLYLRLLGKPCVA
jgi:glycosyltransferase involved in cell wall biosynthesis